MRQERTESRDEARSSSTTTRAGTGEATGKSAGSLTSRSATELAELIARGEVSVVEVTRTCIDRIETVNPKLNAVVVDRFEQALDEAREKDAQRAQGALELGPLFGVPCTIKEFLAVTGMPQTAGIVSRKNQVATTDAVVVRRLRKAGAVVLGVTNVPEGGLWLETDNRLYGRTNNPWDLSRTSGGSSGGEGAIVAAGGVPFGIGSDIGGSIRLPAAFCGIVGHKPTGRMLPNTGQFPEVHGDLSAFLCQGPLTRSVEDAELLLGILRGKDEGDASSRDFPRHHSSEVQIEDLDVYVIADSGRDVVQPVMREAVHSAKRSLSDRGARIHDLKLPSLARGLELWLSLVQEAAKATDQGDYSVLLASGSNRDRIRPGIELARAVLGRSPHTVPALVLCLLSSVSERLPGLHKKLLAEARTLQAELDRLLANNAVLLYPPYTRPAPKHREPWLYPRDVAHTAVFNPFELPATVVPTGLDARGLPVSVQIISGRGNDHIGLAAARVVEAAHGRARMAPLG